MNNTILKTLSSLVLVPVLIFASGCSTRVSTGYGYDYGHHTSVNVHGHGSAAGVVGALIVGGLIGAAINESKQNAEKQQTEEASQNPPSNAQQELVEAESNESSTVAKENEYQIVLAERNSKSQSTGNPKVQWYQYGKDGHCYLMGVDQGVTDVISAVPNNQCGE